MKRLTRKQTLQLSSSTHPPPELLTMEATSCLLCITKTCWVRMTQVRVSSSRAVRSSSRWHVASRYCTNKSNSLLTLLHMVGSSHDITTWKNWTMMMRSSIWMNNRRKVLPTTATVRPREQQHLGLQLSSYPTITRRNHRLKASSSCCSRVRRVWSSSRLAISSRRATWVSDLAWMSLTSSWRARKDVALETTIPSSERCNSSKDWWNRRRHPHLRQRCLQEILRYNWISCRRRESRFACKSIAI